jgi:hypothetical protein|tara:strand:- start:1098 stop:1280 length:183 start_codon:yes stop_codon:yes gene_type:complete
MALGKMRSVSRIVNESLGRIGRGPFDPNAQRGVTPGTFQLFVAGRPRDVTAAMLFDQPIG